MYRKVFAFCIMCLFHGIGIFGASRSQERTEGTASVCGHLNRYSHKHLTYKISKYSKKLSHLDTKNIISQAFAAWSAFTDLTFTRERRLSDGVDIDIRFVRGEHGDGHPCFGRGDFNILAHSAYGYVHFNDSWNWSRNFSDGQNLYSVAVHEIGIALGLSEQPTGC